LGRLGSPQWVALAVRVAVILGHVYPVCSGFRGGTGVGDPWSA